MQSNGNAGLCEAWRAEPDRTTRSDLGNPESDEPRFQRRDRARLRGLLRGKRSRAPPGATPKPWSLDELMKRIREAIQLCLDVEGEAAEALDFVGVQVVTVAA